MDHSFERRDGGATPRRTAVLCLLALALATPARAQESFWRGKTINVLLGGTAGSGFEIGARTIARHMPRFIPGNPAMNVQMMPGAGGIRLLDHMNATAPKDGTALASVAPGSFLEPLVGARRATYSLNDFNFIGAGGKDLSLCVASTKSGFRKIEDAMAREMVVAGVGAGSGPDLYPVVLNQVLGTKFRLISGYVGTQEAGLAIERGEVDGRCGWSWLSIKATQPLWVRDKKLNYLLQFGLKKSPEFPDTPLALDRVTGEADRQLLTLLFAPLALSRPLFAPPGAPSERIAELRRAFTATMQDPEFRAEVERLTDDPVDPTSGEEMQSLIARMNATPTPVVERVRAMISR